MRVYLPATLPLLAAWRAAGAAPVGVAHAVTPALREWYREGDLEELEYVATVAAGRASIALLADDPAAPRRRVVVAADVADGVAVPVGRSEVRLTAEVPVTAWASALVDDTAAEAVVADAVAALAAAQGGDEDAAFALDEADACELAWYAVQELAELT